MEAFIFVVHPKVRKYVAHGLPYRAEPSGMGRTEPDRSLTDPVRAYFSKNDPESHRTARFGAVRAHTARNRTVWLGSGSVRDELNHTAHRKGRKVAQFDEDLVLFSWYLK